MPDLIELRNELARVCGWKLVTNYGVTAWIESKYESLLDRCPHCFLHGEPEDTHPFPPNDLNALHAAIPKDAIYTLSRTSEGTCEMHSAWPVSHVGEPVTSEYEAIGRWLLAVLKEKAHA